ncbi:hypothetical protein [Cellulomonas sp. HZM]|uniref:hypothetical protein n=1 Tax=Cellulomonas sp. HZM TaxID=1454010 RepID=UPI00054ED0E0|nr:hypothetical protein [Cellulomonas sp. HZM]
MDTLGAVLTWVGLVLSLVGTVVAGRIVYADLRQHQPTRSVFVPQKVADAWRRRFRPGQGPRLRWNGSSMYGRPVIDFEAMSAIGDRPETLAELAARVDALVAITRQLDELAIAHEVELGQRNDALSKRIDEARALTVETITGSARVELWGLVLVGLSVIAGTLGALL